MRPFAAFLLCGLLLSFSTPAFAAPEEKISLPTSDQVLLNGVYYPAESARASVLLIHMLGRDKSDWRDFSRALQAKGYDSLAIDLRGHGESVRQGNKALNWKEFQEKDFKMMVEDAEAAYRWLKEKNGSKPVFLIGASIGANLALISTSKNPGAGGAALLSPGLDYRGVQIGRHTDSYHDRPLLIVSARDDEYSYVSARYLMDLARIDDKIFKDYPPGAGHGTQIFNFKPSGPDQISLQDLLLEWLERHSGGPATAK